MGETKEIRDKVVLVGLNSPVLKKEETAGEETLEDALRRRLERLTERQKQALLQFLEAMEPGR